MVWGPNGKRTGSRPAGTAQQEVPVSGGFRLRDALILIAANILGQLAGAAGYFALLALDRGMIAGVMSMAQSDPYRNHLIVVSGSCGYLLMLPWIVRLWLRGRISLRRIGFGWPGLKWFATAAGLFILLKTLAVWLMSYMDEDVIEAGYRTMEGIIAPDPLWAAASIVMVVVAAPLLEETAFRAALYQGVSRHMPRLAAAALSVIAFTAIHVQYAFAGGLTAVVTTAQVAVLGTMLMFLYLKSGSLWPGIALHAVNNAVTLAFLFAIMPT